MTVNVPLVPRQGSGSSSDPHSQLVSPSHISNSPPSSTSSTSTQPTDPQSSNSTSSSTTFSSFTSSTSASSPDDRSSTSSISSFITVSSSMATSSSFSSPSSGLVTPPSNPPSTSSTSAPNSSASVASVTGTEVPLSLTTTIASSSTATASPPPPSPTNEVLSLSSTSSNITPTSSPNPPTPSPNPSTSSPNSPTSLPNSPTPSPNSPTPSPNPPTSSPNSPTSSPNSPISSPNSPNSPTLLPSTDPLTSSPSTTGGGSDSVGGNQSISAPNPTITTSPNTITGVGGQATQPASPLSSRPFSDRSSGVTGPATSSSGNSFSLTEPVTFTTINSAGSTITTVPDFFTTVFTTTKADGQSTTVSQIVINPTGILSPGDNRSQNDFFRNKGAVAGVFVVVGLTVIAIVILGIFAIWKRRKARRQRDVEFATGAKGASRARSPLEPDEAGQDPGIYAVAVRHSPVEMRSGAPGPGEEESGSFGYGPSVFGSAILLNPPAQVTNAGVPPEQQPYPYFPSGRRSPSPGEAHSSFARGLTNAPPAYYPAPHSYSRVKTPSPVFGGPLLSVSDPPTNHVVSVRGVPPSAYSGAIFSDSKQPSSEGHGSSMGNNPGPGLESTDTPPGIVVLPPVAYAYEPEPVTWSHRIVGGGTRDNPTPPSSQNLRVSTVEQQQDPQSNRGSISNRSASVYSQDWEAEPDIRPTLRVVNDPRISPELGIRLRGGLASEHSFGPRDDEDWSRRVGAQMIANDSTLQVANPTETHRPAE